MAGAVATRAFQMHRILHPASAGLPDVVAGLVRDLRNAHPLPAKGEHLGLEWQAVEARVLVQRGEDLFLRTDDDPIAGAQAETGRDRVHDAATKHKLLDFLVRLKRDHRSIVGYGVPAKGNVLLNYCGIRSDFLDYLVDRSPYKCGKYAPGTRLLIRDVDQIRVTRPDYLFVLPWNIKDEIVEQMSFIRDWGGKFFVAIPDIDIL